MVVSSPQYGENTASFASFSLRNSWLKYFVTYSFGTSRKKVSTIFYDTAFLINEDRGNSAGRDVFIRDNVQRGGVCLACEFNRIIVSDERLDPYWRANRFTAYCRSVGAPQRKNLALL